MKTITSKKIEDNKKRNWHIVNVDGKILGRIATKISKLLTGKDKPGYQTHIDVGDFVVVINSKGIKVSGNKFEGKMYHRYSGYPGGLKSKSFKSKFKDNSEWIIFQAVKGMLPDNRLKAARLKRLKIYSGKNHPHEAQLKK